jgi:hypothetical protein
MEEADIAGDAAVAGDMEIGADMATVGTGDEEIGKTEATAAATDLSKPTHWDHDWS